MPDLTREKIELLLNELRSWRPGEKRRTLWELADMFHLEVFVVERIAASEGHHLFEGAPPGGADHGTDPNASTIDLDPDAVQAAAERPDPNPEWADEDRDTGVWRKKPTGEWELINEDD